MVFNVFTREWTTHRTLRMTHYITYSSGKAQVRLKTHNAVLQLSLLGITCNRETKGGKNKDWWKFHTDSIFVSIRMWQAGWHGENEDSEGWECSYISLGFSCPCFSSWQTWKTWKTKNFKIAVNAHKLSRLLSRKVMFLITSLQDIRDINRAFLIQHRCTFIHEIICSFSQTQLTIQKLYSTMPEWLSTNLPASNTDTASPPFWSWVLGRPQLLLTNQSRGSPVQGQNGNLYTSVVLKSGLGLKITFSLTLLTYFRIESNLLDLELVLD